MAAHWNYLDGEDDQFDYSRRQSQADCRNTTVYCILSLALLILSGAIGNPTVAAMIPGGDTTIMILSILIVVSVLALCTWQCKGSRQAVPQA